MPSKKIRSIEKNLENKIIEVLKKRPLFLPDLYRHLDIKKKKQYKIAKKIVDKLKREKIIASDKKGLLRYTDAKRSITGRISITAQGYGFVNEENADEDIFIPPQHINSAFDGDKVSVRIFSDAISKKSQKKGPVGIVSQIVDRKRYEIVGELIYKRKKYAVRPLNRKLPDDIYVSGDLKEAERGEWVKADILYDTKNQNLCEIKERIGKTGELESDIDAIISEYNLLPPYSEKEERDAEKIRHSKINREDCSNLFCITIDPYEAKDFDDAVSISEGNNENEVILGIHISDVAAWIQPDSKFDIKAQERGFTSYIPGKTLTMLPKNLTDKISLKEDKSNNFAHSVFLNVDKETGEIKSERRLHTKVNIGKRLTFNEVEKYFQEGIVSESWNEEVKTNLDSLFDIFKKLRNYRKNKENFLDIRTTEVKVLREDELGQELQIKKKSQGWGDQLIEEFMLAANSAVAREMTNKKIPSIYRIHPEPDPEKLEEFSEFISQVFGIEPGDLTLGRKSCQNFLNRIKNSDFEDIIINYFLRTQNRAYYSEQPEMHYGLGKGLYLHFTSPIRRYSDLLVHQQLWFKDKNSEKKLHSESEMANYSSLCTEKEKNSDEAYFAANDRLKLHYLQRFLDEGKDVFYQGIIKQVNSYGILADIPDLGLTANVVTDNKKGGRYKGKSSLSSMKSYQAGDFVNLQLEKIDFIKSNAVFHPVQASNTG